MDKLGLPVTETPDQTAMTQADIYTYRTDDYMLGCCTGLPERPPRFPAACILRRWGKSGCIYEFPDRRSISDPINLPVICSFLPKAVNQ